MAATRRREIDDAIVGKRHASQSSCLCCPAVSFEFEAAWEPTQLLSVFAELRASRWRAPRPSVVDAEMEKVVILYVVLGVIVVAADWMSRD